MEEAGSKPLFVGARVVVGITYERADGSIDERVQLQGAVARIGDDRIDLSVAGTEEPFSLPPSPEAFQAAEPGEYRLQGSGEVVVDPDFTAVFVVKLVDG